MSAARSDASRAAVPAPAGPTGTADLPFEKALEELEGIVQRLEQGNVPLDESVAIYERGEALKRHCEGAAAARRGAHPAHHPRGGRTRRRTAPLDVA